MVIKDLPSAYDVDVLQEENANLESSLPPIRRMTVDLPSDSPTDGGYGNIRINHGNTSGALILTLNRTIRVPDNKDTNMLPPSLGYFPLFKVQDYASRMPAEMAAKGGLFFPMYQREAMWINFTATRPFALKIYVGGVNAVSGLPMQENDQTRQKRLRMLKDGKRIQDYMVVPGQRWLDGIVSDDGKIRQFIAKPKGSGFSVEAQVTGEEKVGGVQIEIIPVKFEAPKEIEVRYENKQQQVVKRTLALSEKGLDGESTLFDLRKLLRDEFDIAIQDQILQADPFNVDTQNLLKGDESSAKDTKLGSLYLRPRTTIRLSHHVAEPAIVCPTGSCPPGSWTQHPAAMSVSAQYMEIAPVQPSPSAAACPSNYQQNLGMKKQGLTSVAAPQSFSADEMAPSLSLDTFYGGAGPSLETDSLVNHFDVPIARKNGVSARRRLDAPARPPKVKEMGLAAGGFIQQVIEPDPNPSSMWDIEASILLNLQILDSEAFSEVTGLPPPPTPIDADTYASHNYPFFEIWGEESTGIKGDFGEVKSVAQIEAERAKERGEEVMEENSVPQRVHVIGKFKSTFRPVELIEKELEGLELKD